MALSDLLIQFVMSFGEGEFVETGRFSSPYYSTIRLHLSCDTSQGFTAIGGEVTAIARRKILTRQIESIICTWPVERIFVICTPNEFTQHLSKRDSDALAFLTRIKFTFCHFSVRNLSPVNDSGEFILKLVLGCMTAICESLCLDDIQATLNKTILWNAN